MKFPAWRILLRFILTVSAWACAMSRGSAHEPFDLSSRITIYENRLEVVATLGSDAMRQLLSGMGFKEDEITERLKGRGPDAVVDYPVSLASRVFALTNNGEPWLARSVQSVSEGVEILLTSTYPRPTAGVLDIRAVCYENVPALRKGVVAVEDDANGPLGTAMLSPTRIQMAVTIAPLPTSPKQTAVTSTSNASTTYSEGEDTDPKSPPAGSTPPLPRPSFQEFFRLGVEHIWSGIDHLLFLAALLIGVRKGSSILGIITFFTLAHSVTLALAALHLVAVPARIIEPLIAASIVAVCIANLIRPGAESDRVWMAAVFGLIHGFGFASALIATGLGQGGASIALPLFSFNLGVEAGQLTVAAVFLPLLFLVRRSPSFVRYGSPALSGGVLLVSGYWLVERTFF